jgi:hypothetical protein
MNEGAIGAVVFLALGSWVSGCRCSGPPTTTKPEPLTKLSPSASSEPSATASAAPSAPEPAVQPIEKPRGRLSAQVVLADPTSEHFVDMRVPPKYFVHHLRGASLVTRGGEIYRLDGDQLIELAAGEGLGVHRLANNLETFPLWFDIDGLTGSWPSAVWASVSGKWVSDGARNYAWFSDAYRGSADHFMRVPETETGPTWNTIAAWSGGRVVGLVDGSLRILSGDKKLVPQLAIGNSVACPVRVEVEALSALATGDLYALGRGQCDGNSYLVEHWSDDSAESKSVEPLPPAFSAPLAAPAKPNGVSEWVRLSAVAPNAIYAVRTRAEQGPGQARLAHFDGVSWRSVPLPVDEHISEYDVAADGSLWLLIGATPYVYSGRSWREVRLPALPALPTEFDAGAPEPGLELTSVLGLSADRAYFGALLSYAHTEYEAGLVLATGAGPLGVVKLETSAHPSDAGVDAGSDAGPDSSAPTPLPFSSACTTPFVVLFSVSDAAPADFDYPATRDALLATAARPAVKFLEFSYRGHRTLGAAATTADDANALVRLISERIKGSKPTLVCYAPPNIIRAVTFSL